MKLLAARSSRVDDRELRTWPVVDAAPAGKMNHTKHAIPRQGHGGPVVCRQAPSSRFTPWATHLSGPPSLHVVPSPALGAA